MVYPFPAMNFREKSEAARGALPAASQLIRDMRGGSVRGAARILPRMSGRQTISEGPEDCGTGLPAGVDAGVSAAASSPTLLTWGICTRRAGKLYKAQIIKN